jgi:hypothetical protein
MADTEAGRRPAVLSGPRRADWIGIAVAAASLAALEAYRVTLVEPRIWVGLCAGPHAPLVCAPRAALLWLQARYLWGWGALALGLWAFLGGKRPVAVAAVAAGAAAVVNYNATWGMLGAALGAWAWITRAWIRRVPAPDWDEGSGRA